MSTISKIPYNISQSDLWMLSLDATAHNLVSNRSPRFSASSSSLMRPIRALPASITLSSVSSSFDRFQHLEQAAETQASAAQTGRLQARETLVKIFSSLAVEVLWCVSLSDMDRQMLRGREGGRESLPTGHVQ